MFIALLQAVIWYHLHEYTKTLSILEPLYQNIEPLDQVLYLSCFVVFCLISPFGSN